jgi:drug/metabolite transporter (DMT)-like permease
MSTRWFLLTIFCVAMIAAGQLLFKIAAAQWRIDGWTWVTVRGFLSPALLAALVIYGLTTILWVTILRSVPLSVAFPLYSLVFLLVPVAAHLLLDEPWSWNVLIGGGVIIVGVIIASR